MAFSWFKKNKNKADQESVEDEAVQVPEGEEPESGSAGQEMGTQKSTASEEQIPEPDQPTTADLSNEPLDEFATAPENVGYFKRLKSRLSGTRRNLSDGLDKVFISKKKLDEDALEELEELLITSDIGVQTTMALMERIVNEKVAGAK